MINFFKNNYFFYISIFLVIASLTFIAIYADDIIIEHNNKKQQFCNRYQDYLNMNASAACTLRCWKLYGCEHNATGTKNDCNCTGGIVVIHKPYWEEFYLPVYNGDFNESKI